MDLAHSEIASFTGGLRATGVGRIEARNWEAIVTFGHNGVEVFGRIKFFWGIFMRDVSAAIVAPNPDGLYRGKLYSFEAP